jgi:hypothetical protein
MTLTNQLKESPSLSLRIGEGDIKKLSLDLSLMGRKARKRTAKAARKAARKATRKAMRKARKSLLLLRVGFFKSFKIRLINLLKIAFIKTKLLLGRINKKT